MFRDKIRIKIKSGDGGNGHIAFDRVFKPDGGNGGDGGSVILEGSNNVYDFTHFKKNFTYSADNGENGTIKGMDGKGGKDLVIKVPLVTQVYNIDGEKIEEIDTHGQQINIAPGGIAGMGNRFFARKGKWGREKATEGKPGLTMDITLELELESDIIFIGLPNTGKSSILKELTNAEAKVAPYAFTTIDPQLGQMGKLTLMDLPGLIENTHEGKGVGTKFLKHTRRAKGVAHFLSLASESILQDYNTIRKELKLIDKELSEKKELIVFTKHDLVENKKDIDKIIKPILKKNKNYIITSAYDLDSLNELKTKFEKFLSGK